MSSLPRLLGDGLLGNLMGAGSTSGTNSQTSGVSRGFEIFMRNVKRKANQYEMDQTMRREITTLKENFSQPNVSMPLMRDYLCRVVFCDMLGYEMTWSYIHAVKLAQQGANLEKRMGYLACSLLLYREHELILLLINTIQKDLKSSNILDNMVAMTAAGHLVPSENIPMLLPLVLEKLRHSRELVRQRAVVTLHQFQLLAPDLVDHCQEVLRKALFDKDPSVMAATVNLVYDQVKQNPSKHRSLMEGLLSVLRQAVGRKLGSTYEYHSIPAPWLQIQLIRTLTLLAKDSQQHRHALLPLFEEIIQKTGTRENMSFAILYECLQCMMMMQPGRQSVEIVAKHVKCFLNSSEPNLRFIGMKVLMNLVETDERYVTQYQTLIMDSLDNPDINVQKKMHRLLFKIANKSNGSAVCSQLLQQLPSSSDRYWRTEVVNMVLQLIQRFSDPQEWQIQSLFSCLQMAADLIDSTITRNIITYLEKEIVSNVTERQSQCDLLVKCCVHALQSDKVTTPVMKICAWVLSELSPLLKNPAGDAVSSLLSCHLKNPSTPVCTMISLVTGLQKLVVTDRVDKVTMATSLRDILRCNMPVVVHQRLTLLLTVCEKDLKLTYQTEKTSIDTTLSFLDDHVSQCLESGLPAYIPVHLRRQNTDSLGQQDVSQYTVDTEGDTASSSVGRLRTESTTSSNRTYEDLRESETNLPSVKKMWSKEGRHDPDSLSGNVVDNQHARKDVPDHHQKLAQALFSGIPALTKENESEQRDFLFFDEDDKVDAENVSSTSGNSPWQSLHSSPKALATTSPSQVERTSLPGDNENQFLNNDDLTNNSDTSMTKFASSTPVAVAPKGHLDISDNLTEESTVSLPRGDNSSFLNISVSSNDVSRVSVSRVDSRAESRQSVLEGSIGNQTESNWNVLGNQPFDSNSLLDACTSHDGEKSLNKENQQIGDSDKSSEHQSIYTEGLYDAKRETEEVSAIGVDGFYPSTEGIHNTIKQSIDTDSGQNNIKSIYDT